MMEDKKYFVYVLWSNRLQKHYTGHTNMLARRIHEHNDPDGYIRFTKRGIPWELKFYEEFRTRSDAIKREKYLKTGAGRDWLKRNGIIP